MARKRRKRLILPPPCENCGNPIQIGRSEPVEVPVRPSTTYAVIVACTACGATFSLVSRN